MQCPRCGFGSDSDTSCPRCGVFFAKLREKPPEPRFKVAPRTEKAGSPWASAFWVALALAATAGSVLWLRPRPKVERPAESTAPSPLRPVQAGRTRLSQFPVSALLPLPQPKGGVTPEDGKIFDEASSRLSANTATADDLKAAKGLLARYPAEEGIRQLVLELLLELAQHDEHAGRSHSAIAYLREAMALPWSDGRPRSRIVDILMAGSAWHELEIFAQECVTSNNRDAEAWYLLGYAHYRQDRAREASQALRNCLNLNADHVQAKALLARIEKNVADESGMKEQSISHFHVRYDGDAHEDVGREILSALERHYATLVRTLDYEPVNTIPVILFSREQYFDASGAPAWSGGVFTHNDARIRIPIGGVTRELTPSMDNTLMHELTHAFIHEKAGGFAPREIHEGLAQYMAGDRITDRLSDRTALATFASGRMTGVWGFYLDALSLVEYLEEQRGQGGINDLLAAMKTTGGVDSAFRQVYGQDFATTQAEWRDRLRQEYGGG